MLWVLKHFSSLKKQIRYKEPLSDLLFQMLISGVSMIRSECGLIESMYFFFLPRISWAEAVRGSSATRKNKSFFIIVLLQDCPRRAARQAAGQLSGGLYAKPAGIAGINLKDGRRRE